MLLFVLLLHSINHAVADRISRCHGDLQQCVRLFHYPIYMAVSPFSENCVTYDVTRQLVLTLTDSINNQMNLIISLQHQFRLPTPPLILYSALPTLTRFNVSINRNNWSVSNWHI